jgi:hypothetical protein
MPNYMILICRGKLIKEDERGEVYQLGEHRYIAVEEWVEGEGTRHVIEIYRE